MIITSIIFIVACINLFLAIFSIIKIPKNNFIKWYFALFAFSTSVWCYSNSIFNFTDLYLFFKIDYALGAIVFVMSVAFVNAFSSQKKISIKLKLFLIIIAVIMSVFCLFDNIFFINSDKFSSNIKYTSFFNIYSVYSLGVLLYAIIKMIFNINNYIGIKRLQSIFILLGLLFFGFFSLIFSFILPSLNIIVLRQLDTPTSLFFVGFSLYAIIRYKFLDIQTVLHKIIAWIIASSLVIIPIFLFMFYARSILQIMTGIQLTISAIAVIYLYVAYYKWIQPRIDQAFQRAKYNYKDILANLNNEFSGILEITKLIDRIKSKLQDTLYVRNPYIALIENASYNNYTSALNLNKYKTLFDYVLNEKKILEKDAVEFAETFQGIKPAFMEFYADTDIELLIPIIMEKNLIGIIGLEQRQNLKKYNSNDLNFLESFGRTMGVYIWNALHHKDILDKERLEQEMQIAQRIQTAIAPPMPDDINELDILPFMKTASEVGGDYYDIMYDKDNNLWFAIGDVSGHGVTPGLIMMMAQSAFSMHLKENGDTLPSDAFSAVNNVLYENIMKRLKKTHFMTMEFIKHLGLGKFACAGAHLDTIIYRADTGKCDLIQTKSVYLGIKQNIQNITGDYQFMLNHGDIMLLYTDGIIEAHNKYDRKSLFGMQALQDLLIKNAGYSLDMIQDAIISHTLDFCGNNQEDDITMVLVRRR